MIIHSSMSSVPKTIRKYLDPLQTWPASCCLVVYVDFWHGRFWVFAKLCISAVSLHADWVVVRLNQVKQRQQGEIMSVFSHFLNMSHGRYGTHAQTLWTDHCYVLLYCDYFLCWQFWGFPFFCYFYFKCCSFYSTTFIWQLYSLNTLQIEIWHMITLSNDWSKID